MTVLEPTTDPSDRARRTAELFDEIRGADDEQRRSLLAEVVCLHVDTARAVARRYRGRGIETEDLEQVACLALTRAAARFDPERHTGFLSYAVPCIRGEVRKHFRDHGWTVRPPRRVQELQGEISAAADSLSQQLGRPPDAEEIAQVLDVSPEDVREAQSADGCFHTASLDRPVGSGPDSSGRPLRDLLADEESVHEEVEARVVLEPLMPRLSERDRRVLELRFFEDLTQQEIGDQIGVTQMQVSRMLSRILGELRDDIVDLGE